MRIVVSGGGTGGHIYPALAIIREIKKKHSNASFIYIGTEKGLESSIVRRENIPFHAIEISGFKRKLSFDNIKTVARFLSSVKDSKKILKQFKPDIVIGTGGYVCGPVVYAATRLKIPTIIHEQNSVPGLTNKFLSKFATKVAICFEEAKQHFPESKVVLTGNPRASEVVGYNALHSDFGLNEDSSTVLIFGGSRGARPINDAVVSALPMFAEKPYQIVYVTGEVHYEKVKTEADQYGNLKNVIIKPFVHKMPQLLACVDLVVSRSGATTLAELTSLGLPSVLIPSPYVTNNHQKKNAQSLSNNGAAELLLESELNGDSLIKHIDNIILNEEKLVEMSLNAKQLGVPDASERLYNIILKLINEKK